MDLRVHKELHSFYRAKSKKTNNADTTPNPFFLPGVPALWGLLGTRGGRRCIAQKAQLWCSEGSFRLVIKCSLSPMSSDMIGILYETWQQLATFKIGAPLRTLILIHSLKPSVNRKGDIERARFWWYRHKQWRSKPRSQAGKRWKD